MKSVRWALNCYNKMHSRGLAEKLQRQLRGASVLPHSQLYDEPILQHVPEHCNTRFNVYGLSAAVRVHPSSLLFALVSGSIPDVRLGRGGPGQARTGWWW